MTYPVTCSCGDSVANGSAFRGRLRSSPSRCQRPFGGHSQCQTMLRPEPSARFGRSVSEHGAGIQKAIGERFACRSDSGALAFSGRLLSPSHPGGGQLARIRCGIDDHCPFSERVIQEHFA